MFKFVIAFFLVTNGVPAEKPSTILTYNKATFPTEEACKGFPETEAGATAMQAVKDVVETKHGEIVAKFGCMKAEDNTI